MPSSASTRQISFRINRVAISIIATYSNNSISRNEAAGTIQFITCMPQKRWGIGTSQCPLGLCLSLLSGINGRSDLGTDRTESVIQSGLEWSTGTECKNHYADDTSCDDHVLDRHHAVLVTAQTLQRFGGLNVILQHARNFLLLDEVGATDIAAGFANQPRQPINI